MQTQYVLNLQRALDLGILAIIEAPTPAAGNDGDGDDPGEPTAAQCFEKLLKILPWSEDGQTGQREVLQRILEKPGTTVPEMARHFDVTTKAIVGSINGGLQRNIKTAGFSDVKSILVKIKERREWHYYPGEVLKAMGYRS